MSGNSFAHIHWAAEEGQFRQCYSSFSGATYYSPLLQTRRSLNWRGRGTECQSSEHGNDFEELHDCMEKKVRKVDRGSEGSRAVVKDKKSYVIEMEVGDALRLYVFPVIMIAFRGHPSSLSVLVFHRFRRASPHGLRPKHSDDIPFQINW